MNAIHKRGGAGSARQSYPSRNWRAVSATMLALTSAMSIACIVATVQAGPIGLFGPSSSYAIASNEVDYTVSAGSSRGASLTWNADPAMRYLSAQAYADDPTLGPGGTFAQSSEAYDPFGTGSVTVGPTSEGVASIDGVIAQWTPTGGHLAVGPGGASISFLGAIPGLAYADGRAEMSNLFQLEGASPGDTICDLAFSLSGSIHLAGGAMPSFAFAQSLLYVNIYNASAPGAPVYTWSRFDRLDGSVGSGSMDLPLAFDSGPISLVCGKGYFFEIVDDKETSIPEPASAGLLGLAGIMALVRSRARRVIP